jgi:putative flippase GtrA
MPTQNSTSAAGANRVPLWLRFGFWICIVIAVAVVIRRLVALAHPSTSGPPELAALDQVFASRVFLTLAHIVPALLFVLIVPFALLPRFARLAWPERWLFPLGIITGITAYAMSVDAVGGWTERSAVLFYNSLFLFSLVRAWVYKSRGQSALEKRWLTRAVVVLLGIATTRPVMGVFFATSRATHLTPSQFFGIAFWIGFSINWIVVELWLRTRIPAAPK